MLPSGDVAAFSRFRRIDGEETEEGRPVLTGASEDARAADDEDCVADMATDELADFAASLNLREDQFIDMVRADAPKPDPAILGETVTLYDREWVIHGRFRDGGFAIAPIPVGQTALQFGRSYTTRGVRIDPPAAKATP